MKRARLLSEGRPATVSAARAARIERNRRMAEPTREEHLAEDRVYRQAQVQRAMDARLSREAYNALYDPCSVA